MKEYLKSHNALKRKNYVIYKFTEDVEFGWIDMKHMMKNKGEKCHLQNIKVRFMEEYFPNSVIYAKETNSCSWNMKNLFLIEYATRFKHLARFCTQTMIEA